MIYEDLNLCDGANIVDQHKKKKVTEKRFGMNEAV